MYAACFLAFCTGFLSLSMEILWIRLFSFANFSKPQALAFVLAAYLAGIAVGADIGKRLCKTSADLWVVSGIALLMASAISLTGPWLYTSYITSAHPMLVGGGIIFVTSLLTAIVFPVAHHLGVAKTAADTGRSVSRVYVSNIAGATSGPLFAGFFLLAVLTTQQAFVACAALTLLAAMYCLLNVFGKFAIAAATVAMSVQMTCVLLANSHALIARVAAPMPGHGPISNIIETQYGIITLYQGNKNDHIVASGNVYDGTTNLDPVDNANHINRVIIMSALVEQPARVLMIGLSIGSWLKLVTTFPGVQVIDVIEINPGYQQLIMQYPAQASALQDPRVHLYFDDGRRWLKAHPQNRYDMVIMNTSYHWRAYVANLLSKEFLQMVRSRMNEGAVLGFNATGSPDALKTALSVFKNAYGYENFVFAADFDWRDQLHSRQALKKLSALMIDGKPLYARGSQAVISKQLNLPLKQISDLEGFYNMFGRKIEIITDRNLISEFKYGSSLG